MSIFFEEKKSLGTKLDFNILIPNVIGWLFNLIAIAKKLEEADKELDQ